MYGLRATDGARNEADLVQHKHGSRKAGLPQTGQRRPARAPPDQPKTTTPQQGELF